jgi:hypothetical protein
VSCALTELPSTLLASIHEVRRKTRAEGEHAPGSALWHQSSSHLHAALSRFPVLPATNSEMVIWAPRATSIPSDRSAEHARWSVVTEFSTERVQAI